MSLLSTFTENHCVNKELANQMILAGFHPDTPFSFTTYLGKDQRRLDVHNQIETWTLSQLEEAVGEYPNLECVPLLGMTADEFAEVIIAWIKDHEDWKSTDVKESEKQDDDE